MVGQKGCNQHYARDKQARKKKLNPQGGGQARKIVVSRNLADEVHVGSAGGKRVADENDGGHQGVFAKTGAAQLARQQERKQSQCLRPHAGKQQPQTVLPQMQQ